jgi:hypothetical protein
VALTLTLDAMSASLDRPERRLHLLFGVSTVGLGLDVNVQRLVSCVNLSIPMVFSTNTVTARLSPSFLQPTKPTPIWMSTFPMERR